MIQMALIPDSQGNYSLHRAIHNQQSYDAIYTLYRAYHDAGKIRDLKTQLLPFMVITDENENNDVIWKKKEFSVKFSACILLIIGLFYQIFTCKLYEYL